VGEGIKKAGTTWGGGKDDTSRQIVKKKANLGAFVREKNLTTQENSSALRRTLEFPSKERMEGTLEEGRLQIIIEKKGLS